MLTALLILAAATPTETAPPVRPKIAVLELATPGMEPEKGKALSANLMGIAATAIQQLGYDVISTADINAMLSLEKQKDLLGCEDNTSCLAEIGGALGVDLMVAGSLGRIGESFTLVMTLTDTRKAEVRQRFQAQAGSEAVLDNTVRRGVQVLFGKAQDVSGTGMAVVHTVPEGGAVFLDGRAAGTAPVNLDNVAIGDHVVTATLGDLVGTLDLRIEPGQTARVSVLLKSGAPVKVKIFSNPPDARVFLDGRDVGITPVAIDDAGAGEHRLRLEAVGMLPAEQTVVLDRAEFERSGGLPLKVEITLQRHAELFSVPIGLSIGIDADGKRLDEGVGMAIEAFVAPWPWLEVGVGYASPIAFTFTTRLLPLHGGVELGPFLRAAYLRQSPSLHEDDIAGAAGVVAGYMRETPIGELGVRAETMFSIAASGTRSEKLRYFTLPLALCGTWRI